MFYHVRVFDKSQTEPEVRCDLDLATLQRDFVAPFKSDSLIIINGRKISPENVHRISISQSEQSAAQKAADSHGTVLINTGANPYTYVIGGTDYPNNFARTQRDVTNEHMRLEFSDHGIPRKLDVFETMSNIADRFHLVARQLGQRYSNRTAMEINDEYDMQDLLHSILHIHFDDIRPEDWVPSYAGGNSRVDFLLKNEKIVIETKMMRSSLTTAKLGEQLIVDTARYRAHPACDHLICFVYDPERMVANPRGMESDLSINNEGFGTSVIIRPK